MDPVPLDIRRAGDSDAGMLAELGARTFFDTFAEYNTEQDMAAYLASAFGADIQAREIGDTSGLVLIAETGGSAVGYARVRLGTSPAAVTARAPAEIVRFYIDKPWIGRGIGTRLMAAALDAAAARACDVAWLDVWERNPVAIAFYRRMGFDVVGRQSFQLGSDLQDDLLMARTIADVEKALQALGYSQRWASLFELFATQGMTPARVVRTSRGSAVVATSEGVVRARLAATLSKVGSAAMDRPVVGDWVAVATPEGPDSPFIEAVLERASAVSRSDPGQTSEVQVLAANIDTVFVVHPIDEPPNLRRIERELSAAWDSGAVPVVVLTKEDLSADPVATLAAVEGVAPDTDVVLANGRDPQDAKQLLSYLSGHRTAVLVGPSGAGKSTLINALLGEERQATREVRVSDGRGRHTTVSRQLFRMPGGGLLIDTPGLRAFGLTGSPEGIASAFPDVEEAASRCRFRDCTHDAEPGCAVRAAVESGALSAERLASYHKLVGEAQSASTKVESRLRAEDARDSRAHRVAKRDPGREGDG